MNYTSIDYAEFSMSLITGCKEDCRYCYARSLGKTQSGDIRRTLAMKNAYREINGCYDLEGPVRDENGRIIEYPFGFAPTLHRYRRDDYRPVKESRRVIVNATSEGFAPYIPDEWINFVFEICMEQPQHYYMFLTRFPDRYRKVLLPKGRHYWYGATVTSNADREKISQLPAERFVFANFEPLLEDIQLTDDDLTGVSWVIIGAQTGRSKPKVVPEKAWIEHIVKAAKVHDIPVFMRDNLAPIVGEDDMLQEYPKPLTLEGMGRRQSWATIDRCRKCGKKLKKHDMVTIQARAGTAYKEKRYNTARIAALCVDCYQKWCSENRFDAHMNSLFPEEKNGKEKKLQEK